MDFKENKKNYENYIKNNRFTYNRDDNNFGYIPLPSAKLKNINDYYEEGFKFLDLGCGPGNILNFANNCGYDVTGVEFDPTFKDSLKDFNHLIDDINNLPEEFFSDFDFIYSYVPLKNGFKDFLNKVINNMKVNSYLFIPSYNIKNDNIIHIKDKLYKKI